MAKPVTHKKNVTAPTEPPSVSNFDRLESAIQPLESLGQRQQEEIADQLLVEYTGQLTKAKLAPPKFKKLKHEAKKPEPPPSLDNQFALLTDLSTKLNVRVTPDLLELQGPEHSKELTEILISRAIDNGTTEDQIEKAIKDI